MRHLPNDIISDSRLEEILAHILGELSPEQVEGLDLDARFLSDMGFPPISEMAGLDRFTSLEELSLAGQQLTSWHGLPELPHLTSLILTDNELESFKEAPELPSLTELDLSLNMMDTLDAMPAWERLQSLNLGHNQISSIEALRGRKIRHLVLSGNKRLKQLSIASSLPELTSLYAVSMNISDWTWIEGSSIREFSFTPTSSRSLNAFPGQNIHKLLLSLQKCESRVDLETLANLSELSITRAPAPLEIQLPKAPLRLLKLTHSSLKALPNIPEGNHLQHLDLRDNLLEELPSLSSFPKLKDVYLSGNPLSKSFFTRMELHPEINWHL